MENSFFPFNTSFFGSRSLFDTHFGELDDLFNARRESLEHRWNPNKPFRNQASVVLDDDNDDDIIIIAEGPVGHSNGLFNMNSRTTQPRPSTSNPNRSSSTAHATTNKSPNEDLDRRIAAMQHDMESHRYQVRVYRRRLEKASRDPESGVAQLQHLVNQVEFHERQIAKINNTIKATQRWSTQVRARRQANRTSSGHSHPSYASHFTGGINAFLSGGFSRGSFPPSSPEFERAGFFNLFAGAHLGQPPRSQFSPYGVFNGIFDQEVFSRANDFPGRQSTYTGRSTRTPPQHSSSSWNTNCPIPQVPTHPSSLPTLDEFKTLYKKYNDLWETLDPSDPNIPYPARGLSPSNLTVWDTLWAPHTKTPVSSWSVENIIQANAQAVFLGAVGLSPQYTELRAGQLKMGFDKTQASAAQIEALHALLKKERSRWHSDRLGRRNDGFSGPNVALQSDERARAVFHAISGLMEALN